VNIIHSGLLWTYFIFIIVWLWSSWRPNSVRSNKDCRVNVFKISSILHYIERFQNQDFSHISSKI